MTEINLERARFNMVEQQIRPWEVIDPRVLEVVGRTPREDFVPQEYRNLAFADLSLPLGRGQVMMSPKVEARMLQSLVVGPHETVLEVGTGSGFVTALLAQMAKHVFSVDIYPEFLEAARAKLSRHGLANITLEQGNAAAGWPSHGPYDVIAVTGSLPLLSGELRGNLRKGGRMFVIVGESPVMEARRVVRLGEREYAFEDLFETDLPPLVDARPAQRFVF